MAITPENRSSPRATLAGMPAWLAYSVLTIVLWGAWGLVSKIASAGVDANTNQIFYTLGLLPLILIVLRSPRLQQGTDRRTGILWAFITGVLGGTGNIAFFRALVVGGKASIVVPVTALFPVVTVVLAMIFLRERLSHPQKLGFCLAIGAIYLLSM
jgi:transporter family protein